jgi:NodT family efflux transporter outer membrane factor (OMF) lipoprotein
VRERFSPSGAPPQATDGAVQDGWLDALGSEELAAVARESVERNWDLRGAEERLTRARLLAARAGVSLGPFVDGVAAANWGDPGRNATARADLRVGVAASWELDVWGRVRSAVRAAEADAMSAEADLAALRRAVAAQAAQSWVLLTVALQQQRVDEELLAVRERTLTIADTRGRAGVALPIDISVARSDVADARAQLAQSRQAVDDAARSLEVLLGRYPAAEVRAPLDLPTLPERVPVGLPSELLERRPDVVAADRRVAAAFFRRESAKAARLPRIALTGELGTASSALRDALNPSAGVWRLGAELIAPLLDGGQRRIDVELAESEQREALSAYVATALAAFGEVERALSAEASLIERAARFEQGVAELVKARDAAEMRYRRGLVSIFELTQVEARLFAARRELVAVRGARVVERIGLHQALGGSFDPTPETTTLTTGAPR